MDNYDGLSLIYPKGYDRTTEKKMSDFGFVTDLQIDDMIILKTDRFRGFSQLDLKNFFTCDENVISYRLAVIGDIIENEVLYNTFLSAIPKIMNINDMRKVLSADHTVESALSSVRYLEMYIEMVELFGDAFEKVNVESEGLKELVLLLSDIRQSDDYKNLKVNLGKLERNFGTVKSVTIGVNLDENLRPALAGVISVNETPFHAGNIMDKLLGRTGEDSRALMTPLYPLTHGLHGEETRTFNMNMQSALFTIFQKTIKDFEPKTQNYYSENTAIFISLLDDIRFLTAGATFVLRMREQGYKMTKPVAHPMEEKVFALKNVYNPGLAIHSGGDTLVSNDVTFDDKGRFYIVTGPNHGGKSIFCYSIGMAQALFQLGLYVPAESAEMSPVSDIYTHFPTSDEDNYGKGRLESECARLGAIMEKLNDNAMLLMDETFSSTSGLEAGYIASEVLTAIGVIGCCGIYVTHIHDLPEHVEEYNSYPGNRTKIDNLVALMEDKESGKRSYRIVREKPDGLSYARDIAERYGLNLEKIIKRPSF
ncbi:MAG: hypothetical protein K6F00_07940 [Lachnospiraceae bacterium]|nr:hypothetical protein [Lachnospiraceae bacterium]